MKRKLDTLNPEEWKEKRPKLDPTKPFPNGINTTILHYAIENPLDDFVNECVEGNRKMIMYLQDNFRFDKNYELKLLQDHYDNKICLSKDPPIIDWYMIRSGVSCYPYRCLEVVVKNNNKNYKRYIDSCLGIATEKGEGHTISHSSIFNCIVEKGTVEMLKYLVEEKKCRFLEDNIARLEINGQAMLDYIYEKMTNNDYKEQIHYSFRCEFEKIAATGDIKLVTNYHNLHLDKLKHDNNDEYAEPIPLELIQQSMSDNQPVMIMGTLYTPKNKWINPEMIIHILKLLPVSVKQIKKYKSDIIDYLKKTKNKELRTVIEDIIGMDLLFFDD